jgi:queuine tRNA-ribosyltransferase
MGDLLPTPHGALPLPQFLPDATYGVVRAIDAEDLERCGIAAVVMNAFHLMQRPGAAAVAALGGLHTMSGWRGPIVTDSGGFQAYSLIRQNPRFGSLSDRGLVFQPEGSSHRLLLTPEKSIQKQLAFGADVAICLDDCTHSEDTTATQEESVARTLTWARRCRAEFDRILAQRGRTAEKRPLLFAVIQGGASLLLRRRCAEALLGIGFDGFGYGGWPLDSEGALLADLLAETRAMVPPEFPMHALGVGHPANVVACARMGYTLFDSAMPTRDARHGRLYAFAGGVTPSALTPDGDWLEYLYVTDDRRIRERRPVDPTCDAPCCSRYSVGYLHHLFKLGDPLFPRLATLHNLRFMARLVSQISSEGQVPSLDLPGQHALTAERPRGAGPHPPSPPLPRTGEGGTELAPPLPFLGEGAGG